ncbi:MAG TPA: ATP-binding protein [Solirubrobacterales bacterium]
MLIARRARPLVVEALGHSRVVFVQGARQVGKSTLAKQVVTSDHPAAAITLDDQTARDAAAADPHGFIAGLPGPALIDEVQLVPDLLPAIKQAVDDDPTPGRFLLTGSANVLTAPKISESLAGRVRRIELWPLAQSELCGGVDNFVDRLFAGDPPQVSDAPVGREAFTELVMQGGYPAVHRLAERQRRAWYRDYVQSIVERDLRDIASAQKLAEMPRLLRLLASSSAKILDFRKLAGDLQISDKTVGAYVELLRTVFLVHVVPAWRPGLRSRELHAPKLYLTDTGLLTQQLGVDGKRLAADDQVTGYALETFCGTEILKHQSWAREDSTLRHYRARDEEIDIVLETQSGDLAAVEVKARASIRERDWRVMRTMRDNREDRFKAGVVLYTGRQTIPLGDRIWAVPISGLWT